MNAERVKRLVVRQVRYCPGSEPSSEHFLSPEGAEHNFETAFLCVWHIELRPGCPLHDVQVLGDWYDSIEVACELCRRDDFSDWKVSADE